MELYRLRGGMKGHNQGSVFYQGVHFISGPGIVTERGVHIEATLTATGAYRNR